MEISRFWTSLLVASVIIIGAGSFASHMGTQYGVEMDEDEDYFVRTFTTVNDTFAISEEMDAEMRQQEGSAEQVEDASVLFWNTARLLLKTPRIYYDLFNDATDMLGLPIPSWAVNAALVGISVVITVSVLSMMMRWFI